MTLADERTEETTSSEDRPHGDDVARRPGRGLALEALRERWFACTNALGWSVPSEWPDPAVDEVCGAVVDGAAGPPLERALTRWAGARASAGIGLDETLSDLAALHTAVSGALGELGPRRRLALPGTDGSRLVRVVSLGWTDVACGDLSEAAAVDPLSGLASSRYLITRLAEVHRAARARGTRVPETHALVAVTLPVAGWTRVAPLTVAGDAASVVFDAGETIAVVGRSTVVVLAPREGLAGRVRVLRGLLARRLSGAAGVTGTPGARIVALPATLAGARDTLARLREAEPPAPRRDRIPGLDVPATGEPDDGST
ncbi:GGDEF domain-containing protein [Actinomycetospora sp. TBRC 11914]|uniref:GGDEF domain-containing protein n=1 Tax=Actinomycetospora sp. TBRC 11914 TaxID=2729387 RepID=UPI00145F7F06|nr:GGDEF domain-containing protein [Actinomycetospora sp. TBRC 11914]NMO90800.1 GGDEF domain-containing protein [Actinomycetospora sp. TBRC 11914]